MKILLGITGSIAAYKALEFIRLVRKEGGEVKVVLTASAGHFVTALSCQTLSENEVYCEQFSLTRGIKHLSLNDWADIMVIAPATANIIGKAAAGIGDDLLTTALLSFTKPVLFVPAMDEGMWRNPITSKRVAELRSCGYHVLEPDAGPLASGKSGQGRFPPVGLVYEAARAVYMRRASLAGIKVLITGGRTEEDLDPVRVITNRSSGRMAVALFDAAACRGAGTRLILGEIGTGTPSYGEITRVRTSDEMEDAMKENIGWCDCLIMAAAVGDYRPRVRSAAKVHAEKIKLELVKTRDLLASLAPYKRKKVFAGFSLEANDQAARARDKLASKHLDLIVLNPLAAMGADSAEIRLMRKGGRPSAPVVKSKRELAHMILDECLSLLTAGK